MATKFIVHKESGKVLLMTEEDNFPLEDHMEIIEDPRIAEGVDLSSGHLIYKNRAIHECTSEDMERCDELAIEFKKRKAIKNAGMFMKATGDTMVSATALMIVLREQMIRLNSGQPVEDFDVVISNYKNEIENWSEKVSKKIRFC